MLSADANPRALKSWSTLLHDQTGDASYALYGSVPYRGQYRWDGVPPEAILLSVWKPIVMASGKTPGSVPAKAPERPP